jgi:DNA-binding NtrC family response regulator
VKKALVAIADDDQDFGRYLQTHLSLRGYDSRLYARGDQLVATALHDGSIDVVLLDVMMPGMDGLTTLRRLKAARPELQVIMLSGRESAPTIVEAVQLGAVDYVVKPDDPAGLGETALESAIRSAIEKRRLLPGPNDAPRRVTEGEDRVVWDRGEKMTAIARVIEQVADSDVTVLIRGESGVGKELVARALHEQPGRRSRAFVKVNCASLPADLLESELFGHERGAFTDAATTRIGKFEEAHGGTVFMDEIGELTPGLQAKLLHVLQDGTFTRLGSNRPVTVDVRVVVATNRDLEAMMLTGEFREDLYYRLKVIEVVVPPLRDRRDEIRPLTELFLARYARRYQRPLRPLSDELQRRFAVYDWPGNVRELENLIKRVVVLQDEQLVIQELERGPRARAACVLAPPATAAAVSASDASVDAVSPREAAPDAAEPPEVRDGAPDMVVAIAPARTLGELAKDAAMRAERAAIESALQHVQWNRRKAAVHLRVCYKTLLHKIKECGIGAR